MKHVVIGAGAAGIAAVKTIRALRPEDDILMISQDAQVHSRCMLHKYISGERSGESLSFLPEGFLDGFEGAGGGGAGAGGATGGAVAGAGAGFAGAGGARAAGAGNTAGTGAGSAGAVHTAGIEISGGARVSGGVVGTGARVSGGAGFAGSVAAGTGASGGAGGSASSGGSGAGSGVARAGVPGSGAGSTGSGAAGAPGAGKGGKLEWLRGQSVSHIDTAAKTVTAGGQAYPYDRLLIATGANSVVPPIGQLRTATNAFGLRHLTDAVAIRDYARKADKVAVIGAGLVGLDAAYALMELGKKVTVVEMAETVLALNLDAHAAAAYQAAFEAHGAVFHLGRKAANTVSDGEGRITRLELDQGAVDCDMVVMALGVRPAVELLEGSGITVERAVKADARLRTSAPDVYAAGDVAGLSGVWPNAVKQGEVAGKNMCGLDVEYTDTFAIKNTVNFFGLVTLSVGAVNPQAGDEVIVREDRFHYKKYILRDGTVAGVILQGDIAGSGFWQYLIKNRIRVDTLGKPVWKLSYADFYGVEANGEYKWVV